jgi:hypothetical protein
MITSIEMRVVPHTAQRYPTAGDWQFDQWSIPPNEKFPRKLMVCVSDTGHWRYNVLLGVHEVVEAVLCAHAGITQEEVDLFDKIFIEEHGDAESDNDEPGDSADAPYHMQHCIATAVERLLCAALGCTWEGYSKAVDALFDPLEGCHQGSSE